jgi:hypothetical protein
MSRRNCDVTTRRPQQLQLVDYSDRGLRRHNRPYPTWPTAVAVHSIQFHYGCRRRRPVDIRLQSLRCSRPATPWVVMWTVDDADETIRMSERCRYFPIAYMMRPQCRTAETAATRRRAAVERTDGYRVNWPIG